jgi:hypothetical protein
MGLLITREVAEASLICLDFPLLDFSSPRTKSRFATRKRIHVLPDFG